MSDIQILTKTIVFRMSSLKSLFGPNIYFWSSVFMPESNYLNRTLDMKYLNYKESVMQSPVDKCFNAFSYAFNISSNTRIL